MNQAEFTGILRASASEKNPLQSVIEFVFTDFQPNKNKQGVPQAEAINIIKSGVNAPVKVNFLGEEVAAHKNAVPIGPIIELTEEKDRIIGKAVIWKEAYPDFVAYLEKASASEGGVQFSWELYYKSSTKDENDVQWLEGIQVAGIAIVDDPAYSGRTPLLSFAETRKEANELSEKIAEFVGGQMADPTYEALQVQVSELTDKMYLMINQLYEALSEAAPDPTVTDFDAVLGEYSNLLARLKTGREESAAQAQSLESELAELKTEVEAFRAEKLEREAAAAKEALIASRTQALSAVMPAEDITERLDFILGLSEDQFSAFVTSLQTVRNKAASSASDKDRKALLPDFVSQPNGNEPKQLTVAELAAAWRTFSSN